VGARPPLDDASSARVYDREDAGRRAIGTVTTKVQGLTFISQAPRFSAGEYVKTTKPWLTGRIWWAVFHFRVTTMCSAPRVPSSGGVYAVSLTGKRANAPTGSSGKRASCSASLNSP